MPNDKDGTSLIAFGDVTGKGLQAGMLVALIIGAIRSSAEHDNNPRRILEVLNDQLVERDSASATCMLLCFSQNGVVELANAGQLPPYLNGIEMQIEGALPLGIISGIDFPVTSFKLEPGDTLLMMSDGVAEAQNAEGELFGFGRIEQMLRDSTTTAEIATAAQKFGQTDDILVLRVQRSAAHAVAANGTARGVFVRDGSCGSALVPQSIANSNFDQRVRPGDVLNVTIWAVKGVPLRRDVFRST